MKRKRILIADDERSMRNLLYRVLQSSSFEIDCVQNGFEATQKITNHDYDLIITDYQMPEMNGFELAQWIKANLPKVPIILVTGSGPMDKLIKSDFMICIPKPFKIMELRNLVNSLLFNISDDIAD